MQAARGGWKVATPDRPRIFSSKAVQVRQIGAGDQQREDRADRYSISWSRIAGSAGEGQHDTSAGLVAVTAGIALLVAWWIRREQQTADRIALALVLGGALGNIVDRVRLGFVVDFLDLHFGEWRPFLVFNVADAAISIGVVILLLRAMFVRPAAPEENIDHA